MIWIPLLVLLVMDLVQFWIIFGNQNGIMELRGQ